MPVAASPPFHRGESFAADADKQQLLQRHTHARAHTHTPPRFRSHRPSAREQAIAELARIFTAAPPSAIAAALDEAGGNVQQAADLLAEAAQECPAEYPSCTLEYP